MKRYMPLEMCERIEKLMKEKGLTDGELGRMCGVRRQTIWRYRHGDTSMNVVVFMQMSAALGVTSDYLLFGDRESELEY